MRTVETKVYKFEELTNKAQENAIENVRKTYYEYNDFATWTIDDCGLLEPPHKILENIIGKDYSFPLLKNNRKVYFSLDRDRNINISEAMEVTNDEHFYKWLRIDTNDFLDEDGFLMLEYEIKKDTIEFDTNDFNYEFTEGQEDTLRKAEDIFEEHCESILVNISETIDNYFTDSSIKEDIESNEIEFLENGERF